MAWRLATVTEEEAAMQRQCNAQREFEQNIKLKMARD